MAREDLTTIISRALTDSEYRSKLLADPKLHSATTIFPIRKRN